MKQESLPEFGDITFSANAEPFLILYADGRLWVSPDLKPDDAAKAFLEALEIAYPRWIRDLKYGYC